jgi:hypothetical protein
MPTLSVRVLVAERQFALCYPAMTGVYKLIVDGWSMRRRLDWLLGRIFADGDGIAAHALDHCPALILRAYDPTIEDVASRYEPHAHSVEHLAYLAKPDHQQKTTGRKPGATHTATTLGSDIHLKTKFARLERTTPKRKAKISSRGFSKQKRSFGGRK